MNNKTIITKIIKLLEQNYVFPKKIKKLKKKLLLNLSNGIYDNLLSIDLYKLLKENILSILHDKHIRIRPINKNKKKKPNKFNVDEWLKTRIINKKIGYVYIDGFIGFERTKEIIIPHTIKQFNHIKNCPIIVFDLRKNGGGDPKMVQFLQSFLFKKKVILNKIYWRIKRTSNYTITKYKSYNKKELSDLTQIDDLPLLYKQKVYVLTSKRTFSAAEEFTYNIQSRKRGKIIGEITGGGANPRGSFEINNKIGIFIPIGYAKNPITKTNWEGKGVKPDVIIDESQALSYIKNKYK